MIFKATHIANTPALCSFSSAILILVRFAVGPDLLVKLEAKNALARKTGVLIIAQMLHNGGYLWILMDV